MMAIDRSAFRLLTTAALTALFLVPWTARAQTTFTETAESRGLDVPYTLSVTGFGAGVAAADFDDDGDVDLFFPTTQGDPHQLYRNLGDGTFEEVAIALGVAGLDRGRAGLWLDYDGDHRLDLLVSNDCFMVSCDGSSPSMRLYRQMAGGTFSDVTVAAGLWDVEHGPDEHRSGMAAGDVNGDGYLDIVAGFWMGTLHLYLNQQDGTFADVSALAGIDAQVLGYHQPVLLDVDGDGLLDIFAAVDFTENRLWLNRGSARGDVGQAGSLEVPVFEDIAASAGCDNAMNDMGVAAGDYDGDGDVDFYVTNIHRDGRYNVLLRQDSSRQFSEVSDLAGVRDGGWGWGATFFDADNDGDLDLVETNGWHTNTWRDPPRFFVHQGDQPPTFVDHAPAAGLTDTSWGSSIVAVDIDRDGDLDLVETVAELAGTSGDEEIRLHENQLVGGAGRGFLLVRPRMAGPNGRAIGARVVARMPAASMTRWITAGGSYLGQEPAEAFFGLAASDRVQVLEIHWPDGKSSKLGGVAANQVLTVPDSVLFASGFETGDLTAWSAHSR